VETYKKVVNFLKKAFPLPQPVSVRRLFISDNLDGDCQFKNNSFLIRINKSLPEHEAIECLIHEYAHALSWDKCTNDEHCNEWGKAYSRIYRMFLKEFLSN